MVKRKWTRSRIVGTAAAVAAGAVAVLIVFIAVGVLVLPSPSPSPVTVESAHWTIDEGQTSQGVGWFGPSEINYTGANGFPYSVGPGKSFVVTWQFMNYDNQSHTIVNVSVGNGFAVRAVNPSLPVTVPPAFDSGYLMVTVVVPDAPGADVMLNLTVLAN